MDTIERDEIIKNNIGFAKKLARQFTRKHSIEEVHFPDFQAIALVALCETAGRYDPKSGSKFTTYAYLRIQGSMIDFMRYGWGYHRKSRSKSPKHKVSADRGSFEFFGKTYVSQDVCNRIDTIGHSIVCTKQGNFELVYRDQESQEERTDKKKLITLIHKSLCKLPENQSSVIEMRYFQGASLEEISSKMGGISKSWISRIHTQGIESLKTHLEENSLAA